jgi:hypothetical protein
MRNDPLGKILHIVSPESLRLITEFSSEIYFCVAHMKQQDVLEDPRLISSFFKKFKPAISKRKNKNYRFYTSSYSRIGLALKRKLSRFDDQTHIPRDMGEEAWGKLV